MAPARSSGDDEREDEREEEADDAAEPESGDPLAGEDVALVATAADARDVSRLEAALPLAQHLKAQWERIHVAEVDGGTVIGVPIAARASEDAFDNHARHLYSLLQLLGVPLAASPRSLRRYEVHRAGLRALHYRPAKPSRKAS